MHSMALTATPTPTATATLPKFIVIKPRIQNIASCISYKDEFDGVPGSVVNVGEGVFSALVKIEVEPATTNDNYVHLRFCYSNNYIGRGESSGAVAQWKQPEEDISNIRCTLFEATSADGYAGAFSFTHVQSGWLMQINASTDRVVLMPSINPSDGYFDILNWDTLVKLPDRVAFKGDNGKYLKAYYMGDATYLQFSSDDANEVYSGHTVELMQDGHVRFKSLHSGNLWSRKTMPVIQFTAIHADTTDDSNGNGNDPDTLFWPIKIDDNTIALQNKGSNNFCNRLIANGASGDNLLVPSVPTITKEARLVVQELVFRRRIYNVRYRMEDARIFGETPYLAGTTTVFNESDQEASISVSITYEDQRSYSFSRSLSLSAGITTTIETDVLGIVKASIQVSYQISGTFEWNDTTTTTTSITATGGVPVPPRSTAVVSYVGTRGTCNVPFSYVQQDRSSIDGQVSDTKQIDGIYNGVNCYNFSFVVEKTMSHP
ncbi:hypothetical protein C2S52_007737 [Perilla frutescens var. hirtella]|nr:hypothetical protein C2S52_007737 [Perilla frutescens var. hirtella]